MITKAKRRTPVNLPAQVLVINAAIKQLKDARDLLRGVGSKPAADYVARAIKSAEGAKRHAISMQYRS